MGRQVKTFRADPDVEKLIDEKLEHGEFGPWINTVIRDQLAEDKPLPSPQTPGKVKAGKSQATPTSLGEGHDTANSDQSTTRAPSSTESGNSSSEPELTPSNGSPPEPDTPPLQRLAERLRGGS